jgi:hypothetical protein
VGETGLRGPRDTCTAWVGCERVLPVMLPVYTAVILSNSSSEENLLDSLSALGDR